MSEYSTLKREFYELLGSLSIKELVENVDLAPIAKTLTANLVALSS